MLGKGTLSFRAIPQACPMLLLVITAARSAEPRRARKLLPFGQRIEMR